MLVTLKKPKRYNGRACTKENYILLLILLLYIIVIPNEQSSFQNKSKSRAGVHPLVSLEGEDGSEELALLDL